MSCACVHVCAGVCEMKMVSVAEAACVCGGIWGGMGYIIALLNIYIYINDNDVVLEEVQQRIGCRLLTHFRETHTCEPAVNALRVFV